MGDSAPLTIADMRGDVANSYKQPPAQDMMNCESITTQLNTLKDVITCDEACQLRRRINELRAIWEESQYNRLHAGEEEAEAERNYQLAANPTGFNDILVDRYATEIDDFRFNSMNKYNEYKNEMDILIRQYETDSMANDHLQQLVDARTTESKGLAKNVDTYGSSTDTNRRKALYEGREQKTMNQIRNVFLTIYYVMLIIYLVFGNFYAKELYLNKTIWIMISVYILFPYWLLKWGVPFLFKIKDLLTHIWRDVGYKNVYVNL